MFQSAGPPKTEIISLNLIDINGRLVKRLINNKYHLQGEYIAEINAQNLNTGIYLVDLIF